MTEQNPSATPEGEPIVPPPDAGASDGRRDDVPEPSSTSRRSFVAAFSALGLSGFRLLFAGAAAAPAHADATHPCGSELPNGNTASDALCGTLVPTGVGVYHDLDCTGPSSTWPGFMKDDDCGKLDPVGTGAVLKDDACGFSTSIGAEADDDCTKPLVGGGSHSDQDCNTAYSGTGSAKNADDDCSPPTSSGNDSDCGSRAPGGSVHHDNDCSASNNQSDQDCGITGYTGDEDCGGGSGTTSSDEDCYAPGLGRDSDCTLPLPGGGGPSPDGP